MILTADIMPEFNQYRARMELIRLRKEIEDLVRSGQDSVRTAADGPGYSVLPVERMNSQIAAKFMSAAATPIDLESLQRSLRRIERARSPFGFLGPSNYQTPTDLAGVHRLFGTWVTNLEVEDWMDGTERVRLPLHYGIGLLLLGFAFQMVGSLPDGIIPCPT